MGVVQKTLSFVTCVALLSLLAPVSGAGALPTPDWKIEDNLNDVNFKDVPSGLPDNPALAHLDFVRITIDSEDETGLYLTVVVRELRVAEPRELDGSSARYLLRFKHDASGFTYFLRVNVQGRYEGGGAPSFVATAIATRGEGGSSFCMTKESECRGWTTLFQNGATGELDDAANAIRLYLPKDLLLGVGRTDRQGRALPAPEDIKKDESFVDFQAFSEGRASFCPLFFGGCSADGEDQMPDEGKTAEPYKVRFDMANRVIRLQIAQGGTDLAALMGQEQLVPFTITNLGEGKRIVSLGFELGGPESKRGNYQVQGPATVTVPGNSARNYTFTLVSASGANVNDGVKLAIKGTSLGRANEFARATAVIKPTGAITATNPRIYLLAQPDTGGFEPECAAGVRVCTAPLMSAMQNPPGSLSGAMIDMREGGWGGGWNCDDYCAEFRMDSPLAAPIAVTNGAVNLNLHFVPRVDILDATIRTTLQYGLNNARQTLFQFTKENVAIKMSGEDVQLGDNLRSLTKDRILPAGESLYLTINIRLGGPEPSGVVRHMQIDPAKSTFRLPLAELPEEYKLSGLPSPFQVAVAGEREDFVNPGEARLYNLTILNQSPEAQRLDITTVNSQPGWSVMVVPAKSFQLEPGDTVTVGILVAAPADAPEGEHSVVRVNATALSGAFTTLRLRTIVVTQVDVPDDTMAFKADPEDLKKEFKEVPPKAPGPGAAIVGLLGALAAVGLRRRRP